MKILWHSNAGWAGSGYGQQTAQVVPRLQAAGHEVAVSAFHGLQSGVLEWHGVRHYPQGFQPYGYDTLIPHSEHWFAGEPGLIITLIDVWVLPTEKMKGRPCACWTPVDGNPPAPRVVKALKDSGARPIAMSRYGEQALQNAGLDPLYVPHAIDTSLFAPMDRDEIRKGFGWQDKFVVGMVAANIGCSLPRKGWSAAFQAFAEFAKKHDDAILMCHTDLHGAANGVNLPNLAKACGIDMNQIEFAEPYPYRNGYPIEYMPHLYNGFDVLLNPSLGEGFGIPLIEAQACGTPVIATDWTAMTELAQIGWLVDGEKIWNDQETWWKLPHVSSIVQALEDSYDQAPRMRNAAREFALQYDADTVFSRYWEPALAELEKSLPELVDPADVIDTSELVTACG
jgi:glycosyltransferase involved in cell wall biosynthesis